MRHDLLLIFYSITSFQLINSYIVDPGPLVIATKGEVWPKPQHQTSYIKYLILRPQNFEFRVASSDCQLLQNALERYLDIITNGTLPQTRSEDFAQPPKLWKSDENFGGYINALNVRLTKPCNDDLPTNTMKEQYTLNVTSANQSVLTSETVWGVLRGLETFSQLLYPTQEEALQLNHTIITDYPRFSHRGLLVDTSRHFVPMPKLLKTLDAMSYNKMNVFHWHITDDQSFPYVSRKYPQLSQKGAYLKTLIYSSSDVKEIINYAGDRGIRVMVEFDTPGHTRSWGEGIPELLTPCYDSAGKLTKSFGPMDPTKNFTYTFLENFFEEVIAVFPDKYTHLGGDEVDFDCWKSNPNINAFMKKHNITTYSKLEDYYIQNLINIIDKLKHKSVVWEEVFTNGVKLPPNTLVHVWKGYWESTMASVTRQGFPALLSSCWYLDHLKTGGDWTKYYNCDPYDFTGSDDQKKLILGGEACMWAEVVNEYNLESRIWPRASATAEILWSPKDADEITGAAKRLEEHTCRMNRRGIGAQPPNAAGYCEL